MILSVLLSLPLVDILTQVDGCSCLSRHITAILIRNPPIQHPVMLLFKKLPVHHKHPPFMFPAWEGRGKERNHHSLKHKLTALNRLTWHQRSNVPHVALNEHNKVTQLSSLARWDCGTKTLLNCSWIYPGIWKFNQMLRWYQVELKRVSVRCVNIMKNVSIDSINVILSIKKI